jgi:ArsR family transcriptional regulator
MSMFMQSSFFLGEVIPVTFTLIPIDVASCAPEGLAEPIERPQAEQLATLLKAIADPTRLQLISYINSSNNAEACVCNLTDPLALTQPTVSHHLKVLTDAGLIEREKRGTWVWYKVNQNRWQQLSKLFEI